MLQKLCLMASHGCPPGLSLQQELAMVGCTITKVKKNLVFDLVVATCLWCQRFF